MGLSASQYDAKKAALEEERIKWETRYNPRVMEIERELAALGPRPAAWAEMKQERDEARAEIARISDLLSASYEGNKKANDEIARLREDAAQKLPPSTDVVVGSQLRLSRPRGVVTQFDAAREGATDGK